MLPLNFISREYNICKQYAFLAQYHIVEIQTYLHFRILHRFSESLLHMFTFYSSGTVSLDMYYEAHVPQQNVVIGILLHLMFRHISKRL